MKKIIVFGLLITFFNFQYGALAATLIARSSLRICKSVRTLKTSLLAKPSKLSSSLFITSLIQLRKLSIGTHTNSSSNAFRANPANNKSACTHCSCIKYNKEEIVERLVDKEVASLERFITSFLELDRDCLRIENWSYFIPAAYAWNQKRAELRDVATTVTSSASLLKRLKTAYDELDYLMEASKDGMVSTTRESLLQRAKEIFESRDKIQENFIKKNKGSDSAIAQQQDKQKN